ncbi:MAG: DUF1343 domain-containing protein [Balneolaceae bacterium]
MHPSFRFTLLILLFLSSTVPACSSPEPDSPDQLHSDPDGVESTVRIGAERLFSDYFHQIVGKRIGLVTNHSAIVEGRHLIDLLHEHPEVELTALFGPEHGIRGDADAGEEVEHNVDEKTGIPVFSLYGPTPRPTMEMLEEVDLLLFDIQDVGARFYTYTITMGRSMISAAEAGIPFLVLDRPNPLGGLQMEGPILEESYRSGIGAYPIPVTHGMTVGELARMIQGEEWHEGLDSLELHVVPLEGWTREMLWPETGLSWISPSPNIPTFETALIYPGSCLVEATTASEGRGTHSPFLMVGTPHTDSEQLANTLNRHKLPGVRFVPARFTPKSIPGMSTNPKHQGVGLHGVQIVVTDPHAVRPVELGVHLLSLMYRQLPEREKERFFLERGLEIRMGSSSTRTRIEREEPIARITDWKSDVEQFQRQREPYLLYD